MAKKKTKEVQFDPNNNITLINPTAESIQPVLDQERVTGDKQSFEEQFGKGRTEENVLMQEPFKITLAGKEHEIKPLPWRRNRAWRVKFSDMTFMEEYASKQLANVEIETPEARAEWKKKFGDLESAGPDLIWEYIKDCVSQDDFEAATESELSVALAQIALVAMRPILGQ
jgi:hypothetical protein